MYKLILKKGHSWQSPPIKYSVDEIREALEFMVNFVEFYSISDETEAKLYEGDKKVLIIRGKRQRGGKK